MLFVNSLLGNLVTLVVLLLTIVVLYLKWNYQYWSRRNVPYLEPQIPYGNVAPALKGKEHIFLTLKKIYHEMKTKGHKCGGIYIFNKPNFFPIDLDIIKNIMTKDFQYFADRNSYYNEKDPLQAHLLNLSGKKWRNLRAKLTPTFTSGKMKMMFGAMAECQGDLYKRMDQECLKREPINIKEILACFTTNIIGSCAFGLEFKALEDENSEFRKMGKKMFASSRFFRWKRTFAVTFPKVAKFLNISMSRKDIAEFVMNMVQDIIDYRKKNNYTRNDFMQLMINLKNDHDGTGLTMDELASQCIVFFGAGFETSSTLMTFTLYELSKNQEVQDKLRNEINTVLAKHDGQITYDSIQDMSYLNQVIDESLRMHPPAGALNRKCVQDYKIPGQDLVIEKDTIVMISILGIHYDEEIYPEPTKFDPERFNEKNRKLRHNYAHLPFGEGPRNCIGMRFGLLQSKVGLVCLLKNYKFTLNGKTRDPLVYNASAFVLSVEGDVWLNAVKV